LAFDPTIQARGDGAVMLVESRVRRTSGIYMRRWAVPGADPFITGAAPRPSHLVRRASDHSSPSWPRSAFGSMSHQLGWMRDCRTAVGCTQPL
jgi:hypothetical protein